jgi:metal-responsive CopG/Arc/MetJ family transcriptional regulator
MANIKKPANEATRQVSLTLKVRNIGEVDELIDKQSPGKSRSAVIDEAIEEYILKRTSNTIEFKKQRLLNEKAKRDELNQSIRSLEDEIAIVESEKARMAEKHEEIDEIRLNPEYVAEISKIAINYDAMMKSGVINDRNKARFARPRPGR